FFVISGFILGLPFASFYRGLGPQVSLRQYFLRRLTRLEPPYILNLAVFFALKVASQQYGFRELLPHFLSSCFYLHNLVYADESLVNTVTWSLEIEVQFYVLVPLLAGL